jgi:hypothetical protein
LDHDLVFGFAHLDAAADPSKGHRVAITVQGHVAFDVHDSFLQAIDLGNPHRQRFQVLSLDHKQLARHGADMFLVGGALFHIL